MIDWLLLTRIASVHTAAYTGKGCTVRAATTGRGYIGLASVHPDPALWEIEVDQALPARQFDRTFWHEVAHCVLKHPHKRSDEPGLTRSSIPFITDPTIARIAAEVIEEHEHAADEKGIELQVAFEAAHGPLSAWAIK